MDRIFLMYKCTISQQVMIAIQKAHGTWEGRGAEYKLVPKLGSPNLKYCNNNCYCYGYVVNADLNTLAIRFQLLMIETGEEFYYGETECVDSGTGNRESSVNLVEATNTTVYG